MSLLVPLGDLLSLALLAVVLALLTAGAAATAWRRARCPHDRGVNETQSCSAVCRRCGKDLGFIGSWRDREARRPSTNHTREKT